MENQQAGCTGGMANQRPKFFISNDVRSLQHNAKTWTELFACNQESGESVIAYGDRVLALANQLIDLDPALSDALVFQRVKAGLRSPIKTILNASTIQPNTHATLDEMVTAIEASLNGQHTRDQELPRENLTPRPTPTRLEIMGQPEGAANGVLLSSAPSNPFRPSTQNGGRLQKDVTNGKGYHQMPFDNNEGRTTKSLEPLTNASSSSFQIRGIHEQQQSVQIEGKQQQQRLYGLEPAPRGPHMDLFNSSTPKLGRHEVQNAPGGPQGGKRKDLDGGLESHDANGPLARKKSIPFKEWSQRPKEPLICHYCRETGHRKDNCPTNPRNLNKAP
ncbi:MAG: hypothetical protein Q9182_006486 [Xanthomendoza sp. 2 TL-2023]